MLCNFFCFSAKNLGSGTMATGKCKQNEKLIFIMNITTTNKTQPHTPTLFVED